MNPFDDETRLIAGRTARFLTARGVEAYLVGGAVRDALLGSDTRDLDIAARGCAHELGKSLAELLEGNFVSLDSARDIARVVVPTRTRNALIDISRMDAGGIEADLRRRDFRMDAIAVEIEAVARDSWDLLDPLGGAEDIRARRVQAVSDDVFAADPIRLLRAVRLAAETGFSIERQTASTIRREAGELAQSSPERVREEFLRILAAPGTERWIRMMDEFGILSVIVPELDLARGVEQPKEHYYDVFNHMTAAAGFADRIITGSFERDFIAELMPRFDGMDDYFRQDLSDGHTRGTMLKLAALFHDIAKPDTKTLEPSGRIRFFGHSEVGEEMVEVMLKRLRVGRRGVGAVKAMVRHHLRPGQMAAEGALPTKRAIHRYYRDLGDVALDTIYLNMADFLAARGPTLTPSRMEEWAGVASHILKVGPQREEPHAKSAGLLTGHDVMDDLNLAPGPAVGLILRAVAEAEASGRISTREEALELARMNFRTGAGVG